MSHHNADAACCRDGCFFSRGAHTATDSILVRAYEDRSDLLRSMIIGPENTPYEDAPFVIDWMLDSNFPQTPPVAHFLSWTNGNGRGASVDLLSGLIDVGGGSAPMLTRLIL